MLFIARRCVTVCLLICGEPQACVQAWLAGRLEALKPDATYQSTYLSKFSQKYNFILIYAPYSMQKYYLCIKF